MPPPWGGHVRHRGCHLGCTERQRALQGPGGPRTHPQERSASLKPSPTRQPGLRVNFVLPVLLQVFSARFPKAGSYPNPLAVQLCYGAVTSPIPSQHHGVPAACGRRHRRPGSRTSQNKQSCPDCRVQPNFTPLPATTASRNTPILESIAKPPHELAQASRGRGAIGKAYPTDGNG